MKIIVTVEGSRGKNAKDESFLDKLFGGLKKNKKDSKDSKDRRDTKKRRVTDLTLSVMLILPLSI